MTKQLRIKRSLPASALLAALTALLAFFFIPLAFAADSDTFTVSISGSKGVDLDDTELTVKRGENASVTADAAVGYNITQVQLNDGTHMETARVGTGQLLVAGKVYRIDEANGRVALRLTNVQSDLEVRFLAEIDADYAFANQPFTVKISGEQGVKIDNATHNTTRGQTVDAVAYAAPGYQITKVRLEDGTHTEYAFVSGKYIILNGKKYTIENDSGYIKLHLTDIQSDMSVYFYADPVKDAGTPGGKPSKPDSTTFAIDVDGSTGVQLDNRQLGAVRGGDVNVVADARRGYEIVKMRLSDKNHTATVPVSSGCVWLGSEKYLIDVDGKRVTLRLTDVREDMSVYFFTNADNVEIPEGCFGIDVIGDTGTTVSDALLSVKKGGSVNVSSKANSGYEIVKVRVNCGNHQSIANVSDGSIEVNGKTYRIDKNNGRVTVCLTDVQNNMEVRFYTDYDRTEWPYVVEIGGDAGVKIEDETIQVSKGGSANVTAGTERGYEIKKVRLDDGTNSATAKVSAGRIWLNDKNYRIEESGGSVTLRLTDVQHDMAVYFYTGTDDDNIPVIISEKAQNCSITTSTDFVKKGGTAIYTIKSANGYALDKITLRVGSSVTSTSVSAGVIKVGSRSYKIQSYYDGIFTVTVDNITERVELDAETKSVSVTNPPAQYPVKPDSPVYSSVKLYLRQDVRTPYIQGYGNGRFGPKNSLTRAEAAVMVAGLTNYDAQVAFPVCGVYDVVQNSWYANAVNAFYSAGIERDTSAFRPTAAISRGELAVWLYRLSGSPSIASGTPSFPDVYGAAELNRAVAYGRAQGWINGYEDGTFRPNASLIRAEAAKLLNRATNRSLNVANYVTSFSDVPYTYWAYRDIQSAANYV